MPAREPERLAANGGLAPALALASEGDRRELISLTRESDPQLQAEGLLNFARRQERSGHLDLAAALYRRVAEGSGTDSALRRRAEHELDALLGRGSFGPRAEFLLRQLAQQASEPSALLAMGAAGMAFRLTRLLTLSRLTAGAAPGFLTRVFGASRLASLAGFAVEAPTFTLVGRLGSEALGRRQDWSLRALGRDFASSYLVLGSLKLSGALAAYLGRGQAAPWRGLWQQGAMLAGILLGHRGEELVGLRPHLAGATTLVDSLALLLQFHVAGRLSRTAFGPRFAAWEGALERQGAALERADRTLPPWAGLQPARPVWALAGGPRRPAPETGPTLMMMAARGRPSARRISLPVESRYWLAQVENPNSSVGLSAVVRIVEMLRQGSELNSRQYVELFHRLHRKIDCQDITLKVHDLIVNGLNEVLEEVDLRRRGPRALFQELLRPKRLEESLVPGFYVSLLRNPSLGRLERSRVVAAVLQAFKNSYDTEVPHEAALDVVQRLRGLPQLEAELVESLALETVRFAEADETWFNQYPYLEDLVEALSGDRRVPAAAQLRLLEVLSHGLRDPELRGLRRVEILEALEATAHSADASSEASAWLEEHLPRLREQFVDANIAQLRNRPRDFQNYDELGYLLSRPYLTEQMRGILGQEFLNAFRDSDPAMRRYDHILDVALVEIRRPGIPAEARLHLWSILFKAAHDLDTRAFPDQELNMRRQEDFGPHLAKALAAMPRQERSDLALQWIDRLKNPLPNRRAFGLAVLQALAPYLEPNLEMRARLTEVGNHPSLEVRAAVRHLLSSFDRLN